MKELHELIIPDDLLYAEDHEWAKVDGDQVRVGVSDYAQDQLGDIVFVELPEVGVSLDKGEAFGSVESVKAVSDLVMPFGGEVVEINGALEDSPQLLNESPYDEGWIVAIKPSDPGELEELLSKDAYVELLKGIE